MSILETELNPAFLAIRHIQENLLSIPVDMRPTVRRVNRLAEIFDDSFFHNPHAPAVIWTDFDGVANHALAREADPGKWFSLQKIATHAEHIHFVSLRFPLHMEFNKDKDGKQSPPYNRWTYQMPFFPDELEERIRRILMHKNPNCTVDFHLGLGKVLNPASFQEFSEDVFHNLVEDIPTILLGSGWVDHWRWMKLNEKLTDFGVIDFSQLKYFAGPRVFV